MSEGEAEPGPMVPGDKVQPGIENAGEDLCSRCGGTGRYRGEECENCGGSGLGGYPWLPRKSARRSGRGAAAPSCTRSAPGKAFVWNRGGTAVILVDRLRKYPSGYWCHMVTDSSQEELHDFAAHLDLRRERFQQHGRLPHYDLRPQMRERALALGAEAVDSKELFRRGREAFLKKRSL